MASLEQKSTTQTKVERLRAILEAAPDSTMTALALGEAHLRQGQHLEALVVYQELASRCRLADVYLAMAQIYNEHGHFRQALIELEKLLSMDPENVEARLILEELNGPSSLPDKLLAKFGPAPDSLAVSEARERLLIQRSLLRVEVEALQQKANLVPGQPVLAYYAAETEKRLNRVSDRLSRITALEQRQRLRPKLASVLLPLAQTKGVESLTLMSRDGRLIEHSEKSALSGEQMRELLLEALDFLDAYPDKPKSWVLECGGGVAFLQIVEPAHVLMVTTNRSLSFGSLRFTVEKVAARLTESLTGWR